MSERAEERDSQARQSGQVSVIQKEGSQSRSESERNFYSMGMDKGSSVSLSVDSFGLVKDPVTKKEETVWVYTWRNSLSRVSVKVISYGATILSVEVPDKNGVLQDVVMGFDSLEGYFNPLNPYFGATVGRVANRIAHGKFSLDGKDVQVAKNWNGKHHLHGGIVGFDKFNWTGFVDGNALVLSHFSPDDFEGYPGDLLVQVRYELTDDDALKINFSATTSKLTSVNLTNHSYFNLAGHDAGNEEIYKHFVVINADKITETDSESIPTGKLLEVGGTAFDLRSGKTLGEAFKATAANGYDDNFCVTKYSQGDSFVARAVHPPSGRFLEVYSDQPGVQFYTANFLPDPKDSASPKLHGKGGGLYQKHGSFCFETQKFPDAVNHDNFPSTILKPGETYQHLCVYKFGWQK
ncbi:galactose mutarotase isoform X2 [Phlebotomus argentipes]|uniref:galactose mutarotase isoform X2 n=1 Tax=Phlebotomus argentipes TaxID=94469 RepID=UPI00289326B6|nr:galactose mutarotase isoform X2 [Phlebotomus argentipes]XP_059619607.1 galactose mutarotase isoform X2 [Phlebotomus argentipes]